MTPTAQELLNIAKHLGPVDRGLLEAAVAELSELREMCRSHRHVEALVSKKPEKITMRA